MSILEKIDQNIKSFNADKLFNSSIEFFKTLNYPMDTIQEESKFSLDEFLEITGVERSIYLSKDNVEKIEILFNLSEEEMAKDIKNFYIGDNEIQAYLFLAIKLKDDSYSKTDIVNISKGINKCINAPAFIIFNYNNKITLSITDRRINKKDDTRDVIEKTTLIKDIDINKPHSAHIRILEGLEFGNLGNRQNFEYFHNSLKRVLNIKELNKQFYKELSNWYFWALENVKFPDDEEKNEEKRNSQNIIRFITRFIFSWFLKEKGLIPEKVFDKEFIYDNIIENNDKTNSTYYKVILQNLFFATLNTEMENRGFVKSYKGTKSDSYGIHSLYRYSRFLKNQDENLIINLFKDIPFLNGGLFECLDKIKTGKSDEIRVDMFSDNLRNEEKLVFPDELLFGEEKDYDLNKVYFTKNKSYKVKGLINILNNYKFTVEENTPLEQDVALDPELLGEIFENLLASYNEETSTTARKQTGSFYTPREIVNYMVDSSIKEYLKTKNGDIENLDKRLNELFDNNLFENPFNYNESEKIVKSINKMKIIDPACGSGAFPMGILNKTVKILEKLDKNNEIWRLQKLENISKDNEEYKERYKEIEEIFDMTQNEANYARKLFLIEDCIYGVDIQPIAIQIAKLRFFISLVIEQKVDKTKANNGILTLPNLETKFVSANTLLELDVIEKKKYLSIDEEQELIKLENELKNIRNKYFEVRTHKTKKKYIKLDEEKRNEIVEFFTNRVKGINEENVKKLMKWNPYEQNKSADFFDPEFMFGEKEKFDIVIGNPPYGAKLSQCNIEEIKKNYLLKTTETAILFIEKGYNLLKSKGVKSYIIPKSFTFASNYSNCRDYLKNNIKLIVDCGKAFENVKLETVIVLSLKGSILNNYSSITYDTEKFFKNEIIIKKEVSSKFGFYLNNVKEEEINIAIKILNSSVYLKDIATNTRGETLQKYISNTGKYKIIGGKEIDRYKIRGVKGYIDEKFIKSEKSKIKDNSLLTQNIIAHITKPIEHIKIICCIPKNLNYVILDTINQIIIYNKNYKKEFLWAILNSKLINWYTYIFIFAKAIRTMHFDNSVTNRLPIPKLSTEKQKPFETLVDYIIYLKENAEKYQNTDLFSADKLFERVIDFMVYGLYFENEMKADGTYINDEVAPILFSVSPLKGETKVQDIGQEKEHKNEAKKSPHYQGGDLEGGLEQQIRTVYNAFKNNKLIMKALTFCNVEEVKIIEESIKTNSNEVDMEIDKNED